MQLFSFAITTLLTFSMTPSSAAPTTLLPRAGGPAIVPIPSTCTTTHPIPPFNPFMPGPSTASSLLYNAYYPSFSANTTLMAEQCLQQCYGYGDHTQCKAAFWAENLVVPEGYYGSKGGGLATGCLMFTRELEFEDFVEAPVGRAKGAFVGNLEC